MSPIADADGDDLNVAGLRREKLGAPAADSALTDNGEG